eukprot:CAMPEP_0172727794 /NCGR_PEP_ID=MMETSP1074-20121228/91876_1 /TAXON_ID=2916 /ORGANISM="Ceratium fusus, Strain PA161109" /LENGTH=358 /DNA_ID=CAMNT_0013554975 /DNA_START=49 /DNA_END=1122 /DNA_ORIENTATION=-
MRASAAACQLLRAGGSSKVLPVTWGLPGFARPLPCTQLLPLCPHTRGLHAGDDSLQNSLPEVKHFRESTLPHPLKAKPHQQCEEAPSVSLMMNRIWSQHEIDVRLRNLHQHKPETPSDHVMHVLMSSLYRAFNWVTGFKPENTPVRAVEWRLIVLESFAGVPGFMAAMFRHFRSLRSLQRDHGWIHTLLEEAENERMHLLICMKMFKANFVTRLLVLAAQVCMTPFLAAIYVVHPRAVHRFVGYLEETACLTYANIIHQVETPGTALHKAWADLPAPALAKTYWKLHEDAMWVDCLKCMFADESNHRDVNHTFATMATDDPNPFVEKHQEDAVHAWRLEQQRCTTDVGFPPSNKKTLW